MERAHYRRVAGSGAGSRSAGYARQNSYGRSPSGSKDFREKFLTQCIVCGLIMAAVLLISVVNTSLTRNLKTNLRTAIEGQTSMDNVEEVFSDMKNTVQTIFGGTPEQDQTADEEEPPMTEAPLLTSPPAETFVPAGTAAPGTAGGSAATDFRIDEDILNEITTVNE